MKRFKIPAIIFIVVVIIYFFASSLFLDKPKKNQLFIVEDISSKVMSSRTEEFTSAVLINLDEDKDNEIFISGYGVSNLFLKVIKDKYYSIKLPELTDHDGLTVSVTPCDIDQDGADEIFILNKSTQSDKRSRPKLFKKMAKRWKEISLSSDLINDLSSSHAATCIDRKGNRKYGLAVVNESGKHLYLELTNTKVTNISKSIGIDLSSNGRSILGVPGPRGRMNIFVGNEDGPNYYFINNGDGTFTERAKDVGVDDPLYNARGVSIIDANYDEIPDLVYGNLNGPTRLLIQKPDGTFNDATPEIMKATTSVNTVVAGDFNLDGDEDIYLNNIRGYNKTYANFEGEWHELDIETFAEKHMFGLSTLAADLDKNGSYEILNTHGDGAKFPVTLYSIKPVNKWVKYSLRYGTGSNPKGATIILHTTLRKQVRVIPSGSGRYGNYDHDVLFGLRNNEGTVKLTIKIPSGQIYEFKPGKLMHNNEIILP